MSKYENRIHSHKPQVTLTILSNDILSDKISKEIDTAIGDRVNYREYGNAVDNVTYTHRYIFTFSPISLEISKRKIHSLAQRHKDELIIFFDQNKTFGIRRLLEQLQIIFDLIVGVMLPTKATIIFKSGDDQEVKNIQKSLRDIFLNGNNSKITSDMIKKSKDWNKVTFKVLHPIKFKSSFQKFKKQNKGIVVFEDIQTKKITSYIPYTGFIGVLLNIVYFRELLQEYVEQLITACYDLIK